MSRKYPFDIRFHRQSRKSVPLTITVHPVIKRLYQRLCRRTNYINNGVIFSSLLLRYLLYANRKRRDFDLQGALYHPWKDHAQRHEWAKGWEADATRATGMPPEDSDVFNVTVDDAARLIGGEEITDASHDMAGYVIVAVNKPITVNDSRASYRSFADHTAKRFYYSTQATPRRIIDDALRAGILAGEALAEDGEGEEWKGGAA